MEVKGLVPDHLLQELLRRLEVIPRPVERRGALVVRKFNIDEQLFEVWMLEAVLDGVPLLRIEDEHLLKETVSVGVCLREDLFHCLLVSLRKFPDVLPGKIVTNK